MRYMSRESMVVDKSVLAMALVGYEIEKSKIEERIKEIRAHIGGGGAVNLSVDGKSKRRKFSAAARKTHGCGAT